MIPKHLDGYVLVTGAAGFIGFHTMESLIRDRIPVIGIDSFDDFYDPRLKEKNIADLFHFAEDMKVPFKFLHRDINDADMYEKELKEFNIQLVVHLAAKVGTPESTKTPARYLNINTGGTLHLLEFCKENSIRDFIFASSSSVYGAQASMPMSESATCAHPLSPYAASKRSSELFCSTYAGLYDLRIATVRLFSVYGPRQRPDHDIYRFAEKLSLKAPIRLADGTRDYTYIDDAVSGIRRAVDWLEFQPNGTHEIFNIGGGQQATHETLLGLMESCFKRKAIRDARELSRAEMPQTCADTHKSLSVLGYEAKVDLPTGLILFADWFGRRGEPDRSEYLEVEPHLAF